MQSPHFEVMRVSQHPEFAAEQLYIDTAYEALESTRVAARRMTGLTEKGRGGTFQAQFERDVITDQMHHRLSQLQLGDASLVFGRIDTEATVELPSEAFHIGRLAVSDEQQEPLVVDWRAPIAEPFYRATGRSAMGLARRRHFMCDGRKLLDLEDELFGLNRLPDGGAAASLTGYGTLLAALQQSRTGQLGDIVGTIQAEQDDVIRAELPGVLVVQGGPGTGKTVVALHRAAYLLYTHRFPLEGQGVLVIGPNRHFLRYIERVLPSLGEAGVELVTLGDLVPHVNFGGQGSWPAARIKGDLRMAKVIRRAIRDRQRPIRKSLKIGYGLETLRITAEETVEIISQSQRRFQHHNPARRFVEHEVFGCLARSSRQDLDPNVVRDRLRHTDEIRLMLETMWPLLTPAQLLHDLYGSNALLRSALRAGGFSEDDADTLHMDRVDDLASIKWCDADAPVFDEANALLGARPTKGKIATTADEDIRTYGHMVIDEAQDLTPMQLRMLARRSLNGSITMVGDVAQATGPFAPDSWDDILRHMPSKRPHRRVELTLGYRIPAEAMALASKVLAVAAPELTPPRSVRVVGVDPTFVDASGRDLVEVVRIAVAQAKVDVDDGRVAIIVPSTLHGAMKPVADEFDNVTLINVGVVKGLEYDATIVVEPAEIIAAEPQGMRALYVALTRATKRLTIVHAETLPEVLR